MPFRMELVSFGNMADDIARMFTEAKKDIEGELKLGVLQKEKQFGQLQQELEKLMTAENIQTKEIGGLV